MTDTVARAGASWSPDDVVRDRYRLVDRVGDSGASSVWRAYDERLARPVLLRFVPFGSQLAARLREAAVQASQVSDRRAVPVLDVIDDESTDTLVVVTEWLSGTAFGDYLTARRGEPLPAREAATLALEVARFLAAAEAHGVTHGRVRPNAIMITDSGEVRVRGLAIDQVLHGTEDDLDPALADVHGAGAVLFAGLTGRWPGELDVEHLPGVPSVAGGRTPSPSQVVASVPADLDLIATRALQTTTPPRGLTHYDRVQDVVDALSASLVAPPAAPARRSHRTVIRAVAIGVAGLAALGLAALGIDLVLGLGGSPLTVPRAAAAPPAAASPSASATPRSDSALPIVAVRDFDPFGGNQQENPDEAKLAVDGNLTTAWHTVRYRAADMSGKPGVGLLVDLGAPRPVDAVELHLVGIGTDVALLATDNPRRPVRTFTTMASVTGAGDTLTLRVPRPVTTRYLVVWFTTLPPIDGAYQGGIAELTVLG